MARPLELKGIASILKRNKAQREQPLDVGASQDPLSDAVFDVPTDAPADYGDAGAAPVLGSPTDDRLVEARGSMASPYFTDKETSASIAGGETPVQFSGRYGERVRNAGPDDLTLASPIHKVDRSDPRYVEGPPSDERPSDVGKEPAGNAEKSFPTEQVSFGGAGGYNYTFIPTPDQDGPGIIKGEGMRDGKLVSFVLDPSKGMSEKNTKAYGSILQEMATSGYESPLHKLGEAPATTAPEAPAEAPVEEEPNYGTSEDPAFVGPEQEPGESLPYESQRMAFAERQFEDTPVPLPPAPTSEQPVEDWEPRESPSADPLAMTGRQLKRAGKGVLETVFGGPGAREAKEAQMRGAAAPAPVAPAAPAIEESVDPAAIDALYEEFFGRQSQ